MKNFSTMLRLVWVVTQIILVISIARYESTFVYQGF
jgi:hypothetical protein